MIYKWGVCVLLYSALHQEKFKSEDKVVSSYSVSHSSSNNRLLEAEQFRASLRLNQLICFCNKSAFVFRFSHIHFLAFVFATA